MHTNEQQYNSSKRVAEIFARRTLQVVSGIAWHDRRVVIEKRRHGCNCIAPVKSVVKHYCIRHVILNQSLHCSQKHIRRLIFSFFGGG